MRDKISIDRVKKLHPAVSAEVEMLINRAEARLPSFVAIRIVQGLRTFDEQNALYAQGRTVKGPKVTNAKAGASYHNYGLAIDFALLIDKDRNGTFETLSWDMNTDWDSDRIKDWAEVVETFTNAGWAWGGNWKSLKDNPHLEKTFGHHWKDLLIKYNNEDFIGCTKYINL